MQMWKEATEAPTVAPLFSSNWRTKQSLQGPSKLSRQGKAPVLFLRLAENGVRGHPLEHLEEESKTSSTGELLKKPGQ